MCNLVKKIDDIFEDGIAFLEYWDFSEANLSEENRIKAITTVASICYNSPNAIGSKNLYNRLYSESMGLPSSSFEFVPVLLNPKNKHHKELLKPEYCNVKKFGETVENGKYFLTNFRAVIYDYENFKDSYSFDITKLFNTKEEARIIRRNFYVFFYKVDLPTRSQMVRHRVSWQELSRRYVSSQREPFEFYISKNMKSLKTDSLSTKDLIDLCLAHYTNALKNGIKPQEARRVIPQAAYTKIWGAFMPRQLENFFKLRLDKHAQWEIRKVAKAMNEAIAH